MVSTRWFSLWLRKYCEVLADALALWAGTAICLGSSLTYSYDAAGRLISADYGNGQVIRYGYDQAGNLIQFSQPAPGLIAVQTEDNQITLSWPADAVGFVLETSLAIGSAASWSTTGLPAPVLSGNDFTVTLPIKSTTRFFRLRKQG